MLGTAANLAQIAAVLAAAITFLVGVYVKRTIGRRTPQTVAQAFDQHLSAAALEEWATGNPGRADVLFDLEFTISLYISSSGDTRINYYQKMVNSTGQPVSRLARQIWFQYSKPPLRLVPVTSANQSLVIQVLHQTDLSVSFACVISPSLSPGALTELSYDCFGAMFADNLYWRQRFTRYVRRASIRLHLEGSHITDYTANHETPHGRVSSATENVTLRHNGSASTLEFTMEFLRPNDVMVLTWKGDSA